MEIICLGIDYNTADIELRGKAAFTESRYEEVYRRLGSELGAVGSIILSTCNRTEIYIHRDKAQGGTADILDFFSEYFGLRTEEQKSFFCLRNEESVHHIFRVASGIESMIIGEDQILSQVKLAQARAVEKNASDSVLNRIFRDAITCAKEIKHRTRISQNKLSIASIAIDMINEKYSSLRDKNALVLGIGEMSLITIKGLYEKGIDSIYLANRTMENAKAITEEFPELKLISFDKRYELLDSVDIVVSATSAPHTVFNYEKFVEYHSGRELLMIDMAVPRDMDEKIGKLPSVVLRDIDDFKAISESNEALRRELAMEAELIIGQYMEKLYSWLEQEGIHRLLSKVDSYVDEQVSEHADALIYKLECGRAMEPNEAKEYAMKLTNRILKKMILKLKAMPDKTSEYIELLDELLS